MTAGPTPSPGAAIDVDAVAEAVDACPAVVRRSGGAGTEVATYLRGRRVEGVRTSEGRLEVHIVAAAGTPLRQLADEIRAALGGVAPGVPVDVVIADLASEAAP